MKLIKPDYNRRIEIPGVPGLVSKPVDIDPSVTGFEIVRTLRVYRFEPGAPVDGHAEEDEVFMVLLSGSIELTLTSQGVTSDLCQLDAASTARECACAAYLPPDGEYRLVPSMPSEVAYVRAAAADGRPPKVFSRSSSVGPGSSVVLDESAYAQRLNLRLVEINAVQSEIRFSSRPDADFKHEALLHLQHLRAGTVATFSGPRSEPSRFESWETLALSAGESPTIHLAAGSSALVLLLQAKG